MEPTAAAALVPLVSRRFHSFAEAAESALDDLARAMPGTVMLGQLVPDEGVCRVTDLRGAGPPGLARGTRLPLADSVEDDRPSGDQPELWLDGQFLASFGIGSWLTLPLEMSDGHVVGLVCAFSPEEGAYRIEHGVLLAVAARVLSYEWESVISRADLRYLRERLRDGEATDAATSIANRPSFLEQIEREWRLAKRGTLNSMLIACRVTVAGANGHGPAAATLALKDAAAVLAGAVRTTDHIGRIGEMSLGAVLIGCDSEKEVEAFVSRFRHALHRATEGRPGATDFVYGSAALADTASPAAALALAEEAVAAAHAGDR